MSIASLISRFGRTFHVYRPVMTDSADGTRKWAYSPGSPVLSLTGFLQPATQGEDPFQGRASSRTQGTMYFEGNQDIRIEDEIYTTTNGSSPVFRVRGVVNPGEIGNTLSALHLNMTVVEVVEVEPDATIATPL